MKSASLVYASQRSPATAWRLKASAQDSRNWRVVPAAVSPCRSRDSPLSVSYTHLQDESIKNLPKGQMEILMSDDTRGTLHSLLQVRPPEEVAIPGFQPALYPRMLHSRAESSGANLRFKDCLLYTSTRDSASP